MIVSPEETLTDSSAVPSRGERLNADQPADSPKSETGNRPVETASPDSSPDDELPEQIELTPEIVEDEAMRNDFMLRLAVVLLAVLVACTEIGETATLVHVKTGQYLSSHGFLPPRTDVFSHTATDLPWINLAWLFDLFSAAGFAVGGAVALTVLKALLAGVAFYFLLKAARRDVPSWWASICLGLALIVCAGQFTLEPKLITLLGLALTLWLIARWQHAEGPANLWALIPVFLIWSNMDPRAYLGLVVLMLLTVGELISVFVGRSVLSEDAKRSHLWLIVPIALVAFLINPFGWHSLISPANLYGSVYPAWRELLGSAGGGSIQSYLTLTDAAFWKNLTLPVIAALVLAATVPITFALNWRNVTPAHGLLYLGMLGLGVANSYNLPAVSVVFAVLAAWNAQEWYAENFRQSYSVELSERLFSVGGRAITALAFFGLGFLFITGRLLDNQGNRLGFGFRQDLAHLIEGLQTDLEKTNVPGNALNFNLEQGDVLIWLNHPPFIDTRLSLYAQGGADNLLSQFKQLVETWNAIRPEEEETDEAFNKRRREIWELRQKKLKDYEIAHALVPLGPTMAQYNLFQALNLDGNEWRLIRLGPMAGWFYRPIFEQEQDRKYLSEHQVNFVKMAFRSDPPDANAEDADKPEGEGEAESEEDSVFNDQLFLATSPTWTDELFQLKKSKANSPEMLLAHHYKTLLLLGEYSDQQIQMLAQAGQFARLEVYPYEQASLGYLSLRKAHEALRKDPNAVSAYQDLGESSYRLGRLEQQILSSARTELDYRFEQLQQIYLQAIQADQKNSKPLQLQLIQLMNQYRRYRFAASQHRFYQAVAAHNQAVVANPESAPLRLRLARFYEQNGRVDLALRELERYFEMAAPPAPDDEAALETYERQQRGKKQLEAHIESVQKMVDTFVEAKVPPQQLALYAHESGCVLMALKLLREDGELPQSNPLAQIWQLEAGQVEDAYQGLMHISNQLDAQIKNAPIKQFGIAPDRNARHWIAMAALAVGDYEEAIKQWTKQAEEVEQLGMLGLLGTLPMVNRPLDPVPLFLQFPDRAGFASWPAAAYVAGAGIQQPGLPTDMPLDMSLPLLNVALCRAELGQSEKAAEAFKQILEIDPDSRYRPLAVFYIRALTGENVDLLPPSEYVPVWDEMFAPGPAIAEKPEKEAPPTRDTQSAEKPE